jgi:methionyl-tRNA formyltransferase
MKIFFIGTVEFSKYALTKLIKIKTQIVGVATKTDSPFNADFADITHLCKKANIQYRFVDNINDRDVIDWVNSLNPDIVFCFGWSELLKKEFLHLAPMGVVGFHPAALPQNRGRHPIIWALALGLEETASTFFFMDEGADNGDILSQEFIKITYSDDARSLYSKIVDIALQQIEGFVPKLERGTYMRIPQDHSKANIWRKRTKHDGKIDFRMTSRAIDNLVRALAKPYVGAHVVYKGEEYKVWKSKEKENKIINLEPGKVLAVENNIIGMKTGDGSVDIIEHEFKNIPRVGEYLL